MHVDEMVQIELENLYYKLRVPKKKGNSKKKKNKEKKKKIPGEK